MEDILKAHTDAVVGSNEAHVERVERIIAEAEVKMRERVLEFGRNMLEIHEAAKAKHAEFTAALREIAGDAQTELVSALTGNLAAITASSNLMTSEMDRRTKFLATGEIDEPEPTEPLSMTSERPEPTEEHELIAPAPRWGAEVADEAA